MRLLPALALTLGGALGGACLALAGLAMMYRAGVSHRVGNVVPFAAKGWRGL